ncbi:phosphotransferase [Arthrobacter sp. NPDC056691]|uniref:phosphotransferase n=1 Tax=Arthrobacter sp. NPDC056691 TaxID=3345913 RepID=UPI003670C176
MEDEQWARLPVGAREWLQEQVGGKTISFASAAGGYASGVAGLLTAAGTVFFVKAVPVDSPSAADYITEARVARTLAPSVPTPRLLHEGSAEGWVLLVFDVAKGKTPDEPWPRDHLLAVMKMLDGLSPGLTPSPVRVLPTVADRMRGRCSTWSQLIANGSCGLLSIGELSLWEREHLPRLARLERSWESMVHGETLLHFDLRHDNLKIDEHGQICVLDWGRACIGPDWVDVVCLLLESDTGSTDLESLFIQSARAMGADRQAVDAFLTVLASYWRHAATLTHDVPAELKRRREFSSQSTLQWLQQRWHS